MRRLPARRLMAASLSAMIASVGDLIGLLMNFDICTLVAETDMVV